MSTYSCKSLGQIAAVPVALLQNGIAEALFVGMEGQFRSRVYIYIYLYHAVLYCIYSCLMNVEPIPNTQ